MTVGSTGEFGLIARVTARLATDAPAVLLGPGDDAAVVAAPDGRVVASTDVTGIVAGNKHRIGSGLWSGQDVDLCYERAGCATK